MLFFLSSHFFSHGFPEHVTPNPDSAGSPAMLRKTGELPENGDETPDRDALSRIPCAEPSMSDSEVSRIVAEVID